MSDDKKSRVHGGAGTEPVSPPTPHDFGYRGPQLFPYLSDGACCTVVLVEAEARSVAGVFGQPVGLDEQGGAGIVLQHLPEPLGVERRIVSGVTVRVTLPGTPPSTWPTHAAS